jgi:guanylate kinase
MARTPAAGTGSKTSGPSKTSPRRAGVKNAGAKKSSAKKTGAKKTSSKTSGRKKTGAKNAGAKSAIVRRGLMLVLSSPSGAGKTTLSRMLLDHDPSVELSVSVTTRTRRANEKDGRDYHFIDKDRFNQMVKTGELLEWAEVFGNLYGTPRAPVEASLAAGRDVLFDIDWQGTQQLREKVRSDMASIFVLPPSMPELERRLRERALDDERVIRGRMAKAGDELSHWPEYDYVILNDDIERAFAEVCAILAAERLKRERQVGLSDLVRNLLTLAV